MVRLFSPGFLSRVLSNYVESVASSEHSGVPGLRAYQTEILCTIRVGIRQMALTFPLSTQSSLALATGQGPTVSKETDQFSEL